MYDLTDTTFILIAKFDTIERLENAIMVTEFITQNFHAEILFLEIGQYPNNIFHRLAPQTLKYEFIEDYDENLHRTWYINKGLEKVNTPYTAVWDIDVVIPPLQVVDAVNKLREGYEVSYPYDGHFYNTGNLIRKIYLKSRSLAFMCNHIKFMNLLYTDDAVGGAFIINTKNYKYIGGENEVFYGWGIEDGERYMNWLNNGYRIFRAKGPLFHLSHPRGINSLINRDDDVVIKKRIYVSTAIKYNGKDDFRDIH